MLRKVSRELCYAYVIVNAAVALEPNRHRAVSNHHAESCIIKRVKIVVMLSLESGYVTCVCVWEMWGLVTRRFPSYWGVCILISITLYESKRTWLFQQWGSLYQCPKTRWWAAWRPTQRRRLASSSERSALLCEWPCALRRPNHEIVPLIRNAAGYIDGLACYWLISLWRWSERARLACRPAGRSWDWRTMAGGPRQASTPPRGLLQWGPLLRLVLLHHWLTSQGLWVRCQFSFTEYWFENWAGFTTKLEGHRHCSGTSYPKLFNKQGPVEGWLPRVCHVVLWP